MQKCTIKDPFFAGEQVWEWQRPILSWNGGEENGEKSKNFQQKL